VAVADIDGLKRANDDYGHATGDALLVAVAEALSTSCRGSDAAYRIGGDEFAVLLQGAGRAGYEALQLRLDALILDVSARFAGAGLSVGAAHAPGDGSKSGVLIHIGDERMYAVKDAHHMAADDPR